MSIDVVDLRNFYGQPLGKVARRIINRGVRAQGRDTTGQRVLGIGYTPPYLGLFREEAERCLAFMPAALGVLKWPTARPTLAALVEESELPLTDGAVDRVLLVHALEMTNDPMGLLREAWFSPAGWSEALYVPPVSGAWFLRTAVAWERTGATLSAPFAGVHIVEATKQVYRAIPAPRRARRVLVPSLAPALATTAGGK